MTETDAPFQAIDFADRDARGRLTPRDAVFGAVTLVLTAALIADWRFDVELDRMLFGWDLAGLDWLFLYSLGLVVAYVVVPLASNRRMAATYWRRLRGDKAALAALAVLSVVGLVGLFGPALFPPDRPPFGGTLGPYGIPIAQPPFLFSIPANSVSTCVGEVANGRCHGSLKYPLGTTIGGKDVLAMIVAGARVALEIGVIAAALIAPLATLFGTVAATFGGRVDEVLMRYVDLQQAVPAFFIVIVAEGTVEMQTGTGSLLIVVLAFGLFNWGGSARVVRSVAQNRLAEPFVRAAESAGASRLDVLRRHVVPNVFPAIATAVTVQIAWLILLEATLSFLRIGSGVRPSWGYVVTTSVKFRAFPTVLWWGVLLPTIGLALTVVALQVLGDAMQDVVDPRTGGNDG